MTTLLIDYWDRLRAHDWYYGFADDGRAYRAGAAESEVIRRIAKESPAHQELYDAFVASHDTNAEKRPPLPPRPENPRDWTEDAAEENGNYECRCSGCKHIFIGHKRRVTCKVCAS